MKKWKNNLVFFVLLLLVLPLFQTTGEGDTEWYNGHKYRLFTEKKTWISAKNHCKALGGHLVTIASSEENAIVKKLAREELEKGNYIWIGFTDEVTEGTWKWVTGESVTYTNWDTKRGEPNDWYKGEDYAEMQSDGMWNDTGGPRDDRLTRYYVCEWERGACPPNPVGLKQPVYDSEDKFGRPGWFIKKLPDITDTQGENHTAEIWCLDTDDDPANHQAMMVFAVDGSLVGKCPSARGYNALSKDETGTKWVHFEEKEEYPEGSGKIRPANDKKEHDPEKIDGWEYVYTFEENWLVVTHTEYDYEAKKTVYLEEVYAGEPPEKVEDLPPAVSQEMCCGDTLFEFFDSITEIDFFVTATVNEPIVFDATEPDSPEGVNERYAWDFGDGTTGSGQQVTHTYTTSGTYILTLVITDDFGLVDIITAKVVVNPASGGDPPIYQNIMVFPTAEQFSGSDFNGDGDTNDIVMRYQNLETGDIVNTGLIVSGAHHAIDVYETTVVFVSDRSYINYYDSNTNCVGETGIKGVHPSIYKNIIAFASEGTVFYFDLNTQTLVDTKIKGSNPVIYQDLIAMNTTGAEPMILLYDLNTGAAVTTGICGRHATMYGTVIAFETVEASVSEDLNGDGDTRDSVIRYYNLETGTITNTGAVGRYPALYGNRIVFTTHEGSVNQDLNGDGSILGNVICYYDLTSGRVVNTRQLGTEPDIYGDTISFYLRERWAGKDLNGDGDENDSIVGIYQIGAAEMKMVGPGMCLFLALLVLAGIVRYFNKKLLL